MQAVVKIGTSQYLVQPGQKLLADRSQVDQVLLVVDDKGGVAVGQPEVWGAKVTVEDLGEVKGKKIRVFKYTAKSRRRRAMGFRPKFHQVLVKDIKLSKTSKA